MTFIYFLGAIAPMEPASLAPTETIHLRPTSAGHIFMYKNNHLDFSFRGHGGDLGTGGLGRDLGTREGEDALDATLMTS